MKKGTIPTPETYRGIGLHEWQDKGRLAVVRADVDAALALDDAVKLYAFADNPTKAPEARLAAAARCRALFELAVERREERPKVDLEKLTACVAGLDSLRWIDPTHFGTLLRRRAPGERWPERDRPLTKEMINRVLQGSCDEDDF